VHLQALPTAPECRILCLGLHQTSFVALSPIFVYSDQMLDAMGRTDGAVVAVGRLLRSSGVAFGWMVRGFAQVADRTSVLQNFPSPAAH
jgi:hypothetical protein